MTEQQPTTANTNDWPFGKIIKHMLLPKPKGSPKAGWKEYAARSAFALCILGLMWFFGFGFFARKEPTKAAPPTPEAVAPVEKKVPSFDFATLRAAIAGTRLDMSDIQGEGVSKGAAILALWGATHMKWGELQEIPAGKYGMVMKDPDTQRGARICTSGQLIEIALDNTVPIKIYQGGMFSENGNLYRFIALGSTGEIVANSQAKFCGIVTGQQHYSNSAGGVAHAVQLVGMFDLPENRTR